MSLDPSIFLTAAGWISLLTLTFLEIVLGIDNLVFIAITSSRIKREQQHIGRRLGLIAAMCMRILLLCLITWIAQSTNTLFVLGPFDISIRDLILIAGGIYLIYKGIAELRDKLALTEEKAIYGHREADLKHISLAQAVFTIMVMDIVFSLDSVITAVGLSGHLLVMIPAVIIAVMIMIIFADPISDFINRHAEIKILALTFITTIGVLLVIEGLSITTGIEMLGMPLENLMVYFAMVFSLVLEFIQMRYDKNLNRMHEEIAAQKAEEAATKASIETAEALDDYRSSRGSTSRED